MGRTAFAESHGATSPNIRWGWSYVNHEGRFIIFGAWDEHNRPNGQLILSTEWERNKRSGRRNPGYRVAVKHLTLVKDHKYTLKTFRMKMCNWDAVLADLQPAKIRSFVPELEVCELAFDGKEWIAAPIG